MATKTVMDVTGAAPLNKPPLPISRNTFRWLLVVSAFFSQFFTSGANWSYGVYSASYCSSNVLGTNGQQRLCALPGSLAVASWSFFGLFVGRIADHPKVGFRLTALVGAFIWSGAYIIASFSRSYALTVVSQGLLVGLGASSCYFPTLAILPAYFKKQNDYRGAALGIAISGTGFGGFALAAGTEAMIAAYGVDWALRITGMCGFVVLVTTAMLLIPAKRWPVEPPEKEKEEGKDDKVEMVEKDGDLEAGKNADTGKSAVGDVKSNEIGNGNGSGGGLPVAPETDSTAAPTTTATTDAILPNNPLEPNISTIDASTTSTSSEEPENGSPADVEPPPDTSSDQTLQPPPQLEPAPSPKPTRPPLKEIIYTTPFILCSLVIFFMPFGSMAPAYYATSFSVQVLGLPTSVAAFQVSILNIASTVGRVVQGTIAEKAGGPATNLAFSVLFAGMFQMIWWPFVRSQAGMSAYMVFQGLAGGSYNGVLSQVVAANFEPEVVATALSMSYSFFTYGSLTGPVIQGLLVDINTTVNPDGTKTVNFVPMMMFAGSVVVFASFFAFALRMWMSKGKIWVNV